MATNSLKIEYPNALVVQVVSSDGNDVEPPYLFGQIVKTFSQSALSGRVIFDPTDAAVLNISGVQYWIVDQKNIKAREVV